MAAPRCRHHLYSSEYLMLHAANVSRLGEALRSLGGFHVAARDDNPRSSGTQLLLVQRLDWRGALGTGCLMDSRAVAF